MLGVDERGDATAPLRVGDRVQRHCRLTAGLWTVDLDDPAARQSADAERDVEADGAGRDHLNRCPRVIAEAHDRAVAVVLTNLRECGIERLVAVGCCWHGNRPLLGSGRWS